MTMQCDLWLGTLCKMNHLACHYKSYVQSWFIPGKCQNRSSGINGTNANWLLAAFLKQSWSSSGVVVKETLPGGVLACASSATCKPGLSTTFSSIWDNLLPPKTWVQRDSMLHCKESAKKRRSDSMVLGTYWAMNWIHLSAIFRLRSLVQLLSSFQQCDLCCRWIFDVVLQKRLPPSSGGVQKFTLLGLLFRWARQWGV